MNCGRLACVADIEMLSIMTLVVSRFAIYIPIAIIGRNSGLFVLLGVFRHGLWYRTVNVISHHVYVSSAACEGSFH